MNQVKLTKVVSACTKCRQTWQVCVKELEKDSEYAGLMEEKFKAAHKTLVKNLFCCGASGEVLGQYIIEPAELAETESNQISQRAAISKIVEANSEHFQNQKIINP